MTTDEAIRKIRAAFGVAEAQKNDAVRQIEAGQNPERVFREIQQESHEIQQHFVRQSLSGGWAD